MTVSLLSCRYPKIHVTMLADGEPEIDVTDDPEDVEHLNISKVPVSVTLAKV